MAHEVLLPQWSMGMQDGQVTRWLKAPGDPVADGEAIAEVESSKVAGELLADRAGVFLRALVEVGEVVPVRTALCLIGAPGERIDAGAALARDAASTPIAPAPQRPAPSAGNATQVTPRARKLAVEHGIDLTQVRGSGPDGRIVEADIEALLGQVSDGTYSLAQRRGRLAERLLASLHGSAQLTLSRDIDVTDLTDWRARLPFRAGWGDLVGYAVSRVLGGHPPFNGTVEGDRVRIGSQVNLGFAVALEGGLVTPVIHDAGSKSLQNLTELTAELVSRARSGTLRPQDVDGGTFTLSNLGGHGIDAFTPIINPPQIAILGLGRVREVAQRSGEGIAWRQCMTVSLTFDHRIADGVPAAVFLQDLAQFLSRPEGFQSSA
ncbi:dihydrolipoamide acetyltransferase family protein [Immundisolibacter sp.]|uniref:dihydrolipoamide acetyltransferase family protein n=1 Tax=Immundisolibacter sp. TaxID=1934948 RepID=UPI002B18B6A6|nr:dihydrolipoamide acetyltransferase family protein [Immundisolibacter sp.]MEA3220029.1 Dihydrolipoyllysine-residue succinyltransferase component of 2-oxoglutarate dehydrogenase complex [Immundisolibacter sp.]